MTYIISTDADGNAFIQCTKCGRISFNDRDIANKYCGSCHEFHEDAEAVSAE